MHNHLYYTDSISMQRNRSGGRRAGLLIGGTLHRARLYLAAGVTSMRTTGSLEPYTDIKVKQRIDAGLMPGPKMDLTAPYLEGKPTFFAQMHELAGTDDAKRMVDYWADEGMSSYKAYMKITRDELGGDSAGACAQSQADRPSLFGDLARGDCAGHRRSGARPASPTPNSSPTRSPMSARVVQELDEDRYQRPAGAGADPRSGVASCRRHLDAAGV